MTNAIKYALKHLFKNEEIEDFVKDVSAIFSYHVDFALKLKDFHDVLKLDQTSIN